MLSRQAASTTVIVFGLTLSWLEPTTYCTPARWPFHHRSVLLIFFFSYLPMSVMRSYWPFSILLYSPTNINDKNKFSMNLPTMGADWTLLNPPSCQTNVHAIHVLYRWLWITELSLLNKNANFTWWNLYLNPINYFF